MTIWKRMATILVLVLISVTSGCEVDDVAVYKVSLRMMWSQERFPKDYPLYWPKAQWSQVFGQSHNISYALYRVGEVSHPSVRDFAQHGTLDELVKQGDEEPKVYDQFSAPAVGSGEGETENMVLVDGAHSLVSLICRLIPSPDWFIGVDSLNLCVDSTWIDQISLDLEPLDAGAESGLTFTAPHWDNSPSEPVSKHKPRKPDHPAAGFYYPNLKELPAIAKVEFTKLKEYSTIELNNLARKDILDKLRAKDQRKGLPKSRRYFDTERNYDEETEEITTKNYFDQLKDLEEDPVGTPKPNLPDNKVIVVTTPATTTTTEQEFSGEIKSMDDVVLAVAHGRKMGLGRHLPRHFRSRLHHAVNKIQPNDCLVSEWGSWSPCSVTCGFGDQVRQRSVMRKRTSGGRKCPKLHERKHCGNLEPLDAGAESGLTFTAPHWDNSPSEPVSKHKPRKPDHPAAGFYYPNLKELPAIAKVEFTKLKEYSTIELNNLARKDILDKLRAKDQRKGLPKSRRYFDTERNYDEETEEITTKNYFDQLKDLEEDPVGTPRPNLPDNKVIVVTTPATTTTTEQEFSGEIKSMDDVVLAVAHGRKMGLGRHLPRHFRSRLHHAVNKIQPNDCLVSEWGSWSPCSVTCGFGDQVRQRSVLRKRTSGGRKCPKLHERKHCGNVNSCAHVDYFEW